MSDTKIEWTEKTWNPITGCSKISDGCANCYAELVESVLETEGQAVAAQEKLFRKIPGVKWKLLTSAKEIHAALEELCK